MNIGFSTIYAYRPHVKHLAFLAQEAQKQGHEISWLECNGAFKHCYAKLNSNRLQKYLSCIKCKYGGLSGFLNKKPEKISDYLKNISIKEQLIPGYSAVSSVASKYGLEDSKALEAEYVKDASKNIEVTVVKATIAAKKWIIDKKLDLVFCFNGRIDITNGIKQAAEDLGVGYVSVERSWIGVGIQLTFNGTPLSLKGFHQILDEWSDKPLTKIQIGKAFITIANRFTGQAYGEFQQYNSNTNLDQKFDKIKWLYLPSSVFERIGHPDWECEWKNDFEVFRSLFSQNILDPKDLVVRGHPQWAIYSPASNDKYLKWCKEIGARYISSDSEIRTHDLIWNAESLIVYGSSSAFEAGILGKYILNLSTTFYSQGKFIDNLTSLDQIKGFKPSKMSEIEIIRMTLRAAYSIHYRYMQLTENIKAKSSAVYSFSPILDDKYFDKILSGNKIPVNDKSFANSDNEENIFIDSYIKNIYSNINSKKYCGNVNDLISEVFSGTKLKRKSKYSIIDFYEDRI
jgi:hypothetical protein